MHGISQVSTATKIPGIRPAVKATAAVNTVSRKRGNLKKFITEVLRRRFTMAVKTQITTSLTDNLQEIRKGSIWAVYKN
jgi:hypothetical protein